MNTRPVPALGRDELVSRLVRAGELEVAGADPAEVATYFDTEQFAFHGPDGWETDYAGLASWFVAFREAFRDRGIRRGIVVVEGRTIACQTFIDGTFVRPFSQSPAGLVQPNGAIITMDFLQLFRFDVQGRIVEEHARTDFRSFLRDLGVPDE